MGGVFSHSADWHSAWATDPLADAEIVLENNERVRINLMSWPPKTDDDHYQLHDATVFIRRATEKYRAKPDDREFLKRLVKFFRSHGFTCAIDPRTAKDYPSLKYDHYKGKHKDGLEVSLGRSGMQIEVKFFQSIIADNPNGGEYDFHREKNMPYLIRLRYLWALKQLRALLEFYDYRCATLPPTTDAIEQIRRSRDEDFSGRWAATGNREWIGEWYSYNCTDGDGNQIKEGDVYYTRDFKGYLVRGVAYYRLNSMWQLVSNGRSVAHVSCGRCFSWKPGLKRKDYSNGHKQSKIDRINAVLATTVKTEDFRRAALIKAARDRVIAA